MNTFQAWGRMTSIGSLAHLSGDDIDNPDDLVRHNLVQGAYEETNRLNRLVSNLLEMSRLQAGSHLLNCELYDVFEVISVARSQLNDMLTRDKDNIHAKLAQVLD